MLHDLGDDILLDLGHRISPVALAMKSKMVMAIGRFELSQD